MSELQERAEQFATDLASMNIAGLMLVFTPEGMNKAMMMQQQMQAQGSQKPVTGHAVRLGAEDGDDTLVDIDLQNEDGQVTIETRWRQVDGAWKVNDLQVKEG